MILIPDFLSPAPRELQRAFTQSASAFAFPTGRQLLAPGQPCAGMAFVVRGCIRVFLLGQDGREITLYRIEAGQSCLLTASCILGNSAFPASAVVESEAHGSIIPSAPFRAWVAREEFWRAYVFRMIGERMATLLARFEEAAFDSLETRLARVFQRRLNPGKLSFPTTHQQLADELGSAREVVSRALERWQANGWVRLHRGTIDVLRPAEIQRAVSIDDPGPRSSPAPSTSPPKSALPSATRRRRSFPAGAGARRQRRPRRTSREKKIRKSCPKTAAGRK